MPTKEQWNEMFQKERAEERKEVLIATAGGLALRFVRAFSEWKNGKADDKCVAMMKAFYAAENARLDMEIALAKERLAELKAGGPVALEA
jgi:hypothetical protein